MLLSRRLCSESTQFFITVFTMKLCCYSGEISIYLFLYWLYVYHSIYTTTICTYIYIPSIYIYHIVHTVYIRVYTMYMSSCHELIISCQEQSQLVFNTLAIWAHVMGCQAMSSHKPVRNNAIVQVLNYWYRHIEWWYSLPTSCGKLSCEKVSYKGLYIWYHIHIAWQPLISYVYLVFHRKAYHMRLAGYTLICNVWIPLYQYCNSCTIAMFLTGLWLDIPWHVPKWPVYG
jgi:hypothetical protein